MNTDTLLTDDHVAELLAKEADDYSLRYSSMGLEAYRSSRPNAKAKPNTRFLRNIIRETKNHNEALLAKEAAEAQARLESLAEAKAREERKHRPAAQDLRRRQLGAITATLQGKKRKAGENEGGSAAKERHSAAGSYGIRSDKVADPSGQGATATGKAEERDRHRRRNADHDSERQRSRRNRSRSPQSDNSTSKRHGRRHRSRSPVHKERRSRHSPHDSRRHRDRSPSGSESSTDKQRASHRKHRSSRHRHRDDDGETQPSSPRSHRHKPPADKRDDDSDPLESLIGPIPPPPPQVRRKGRGALSGPSAMDSRFSESYDPTADIQPDSDLEGDDWADSLEALKDRERWRRQGAERLRAAGFTDEQIKGWEKSGTGKEKVVEDVKWAKEGEGREWDRGKGKSGVLGWDV